MEKIYGQFDLETIEKLAKIVADNDLGEITITGDGNNKITVKGKKTVLSPAMTAVPAPAVPQTLAVTPGIAEKSASAVETVSGNMVRSPIVGTFYAAPSPDKPPFVKLGDKVKKGDVIMIIESMKLMNEIKSEFDGSVKEILVSDGQAVEFDQPIMIIE